MITSAISSEPKVKRALHQNLDRYLNACLGKGDNIQLVSFIIHLCMGGGWGRGEGRKWDLKIKPSTSETWIIKA